MIWKTRLMTLYSVSRVNRPSRFATAPPAGALVVLPLTGGCRAERDWGRSQSVRKCAPKRQVREHMDAKGPICVRKCARSSFRRALRDANERIRARTLEIPRLTSFISSNGIPTAIHSSSTVHSQYVVAKPQHNQAPPQEKSPQRHFLGFKGLIAALADIYPHFKGLLFVNPPYIDGDIPPLILRILADSNPSKRR